MFTIPPQLPSILSPPSTPTKNPGKRIILRRVHVSVTIVGRQSTISPLVRTRLRTRGAYRSVNLTVNLAALLEANTTVKVGFFLGTKKIVSRGVVRNARLKGEDS